MYGSVCTLTNFDLLDSEICKKKGEESEKEILGCGATNYLKKVPTVNVSQVLSCDCWKFKHYPPCLPPIRSWLVGILTLSCGTLARSGLSFLTTSSNILKELSEAATATSAFWQSLLSHQLVLCLKGWACPQTWSSLIGEDLECVWRKRVIILVRICRVLVCSRILGSKITIYWYLVVRIIRAWTSISI